MWLPLNLGKRGSLDLSIIDRFSTLSELERCEIENTKFRFSVAVMEATVDYQYHCLSDSLDFTDDWGFEHEIIHVMTGIIVDGDDLSDCIEECKNQIIAKQL